MDGAAGGRRVSQVPPLVAALVLSLGLLAACASAKTLERDVFALLAFHAEVSGRDPEWTGAMAKWPVDGCTLTGACQMDPCGFSWEGGWEGISCRYQENWDRSIPRVVTNIHLPKHGLSGNLPKTLALFANLTEIDFDTNQLTGPLPPEWGCLRNMIEIDLTKNQLAGAIPPQWGLMRGLIEMELDDNPGLTGCLPDGTPPQERWCSSWAATKCVAFTTDRLLGTATGGTQLRGRCAPYPGGDAALAAGLRCPTIEDYRQPLTRFFARRERGGVQALPQGGVGARPATLPAKPALEAAAAAAPAAAFTPVENRMPTLFANLG